MPGRGGHPNIDQFQTNIHYLFWLYEIKKKCTLLVKNYLYMLILLDFTKLYVKTNFYSYKVMIDYFSYAIKFSEKLTKFSLLYCLKCMRTINHAFKIQFFI